MATEQEEFEFRARAERESAQKTPLWRSALNMMGSYSASPQYATSPQGMLEKLSNLASRGANKAGEFVATQAAGRGMNPYAAAGIGTAMALTPDMIMSAATPVGEPEQAPRPAVGMARRTLGFPKGMLKTPFARGKAANAAKVALEEGVIPGSGSADVAFSRANELKGSTGRQLGEIRESVGPQEIKPVFRQLDMLRRKLTEGGARGGAWDLVNEKINFAKRTLQGLYESASNKPIFEEAAPEALPPQPTPAPPTPQAPLAPTLRPGIGPQPRPALGMRGETLPNTDVMADAPVRPQLDYWNKNPNFPKKKPTVIDAEIITDQAAERAGKFINRVGLNSVEAAKKRLGGSVNWLSDLNAQKDAKGISNAIEAGVEHILRENGVPMDLYRSLKNKYGAASSMVQGLNNELAGAEGRMMPSAAGLVVGAGKLAGGDAMGALRDVGLMELSRRRLAGVIATSLYKTGETVPRAVTALRSLRRLRGKDEDSNSQR